MKVQKKMNEVKNEVVVEKPKRIRRERKFFLYVEGKGFIRMDKEAGAMPNFKDGELLCYTSRVGAMYAREFFISIHLADNIDIMAKVA